MQKSLRAWFNNYVHSVMILDFYNFWDFYLLYYYFLSDPSQIANTFTFFARVAARKLPGEINLKQTGDRLIKIFVWSGINWISQRQVSRRLVCRSYSADSAQRTRRFNWLIIFSPKMEDKLLYNMISSRLWSKPCFPLCT